MLLKKLAKYIFYRLPIRVRCLVEAKRSQGEITVGRGSYVHPSVHLLGKGNIRVGVNSCLSEDSWLNVNHRLENEISIEIGNNCFIGKQNFFTSGKKISIGDYTLTTIGCKFVGSSHVVSNPEIPYLLTGTTSSDEIRIGVNCFIGAGTMVLGTVEVGHGSVIGANSLVIGDIPPFSIATGNPAKVIKRYSFIKRSWIPVSEISANEEIEMPNELEYLKCISEKYKKIDIPWIAAGKSMGDL